jgi:hypothetical protein
VFVLDEGKALQQAITISRQLGTQVVVAEGIKAGQQVILNPPKSLRSDMSVEVFDASKAGEGKERKRGKRKEAADAAAGSTTP